LERKIQEADYSEIIDRLSKRSGNRQTAEEWFTTYQIPSLGHCTAKEMVDKGDRKALLLFLDHLDHGSYA
jgi:hypothetical protein